jgi:hypothetical protein
LTQGRLDDSVDHSVVVDTILCLALQRVRKLQEQAAISDDSVSGF